MKKNFLQIKDLKLLRILIKPRKWKQARVTEKVDKRVKNSTVFLQGATFTMIWSASPDYTVKEGLFPDKEPTPYLYCKLKHMLTVDTVNADHDKLHDLLTRIKNSLDYSRHRELQNWIQLIMNHMTKERNEPSYRRRHAAFLAGYVLRETHQTTLDDNLRRAKRGAIEEHAVAYYREAMDAKKQYLLQGYDRKLSHGLNPTQFKLK